MGAAPQGWWHHRAVRADGTVAAFSVVQSDAHADGVRIDGAAGSAPDPGGAQCIARCDEAGQVTALELAPTWAPKAPPLWFAELDEPDGTPPAVNLLAFSGHDVEVGRLVDREALRDVAVTSDDQLAAMRWYPATGEIDQIYVSPTARRRGIATALVMAVGTLAVAREWPRVWGDGQRTAEGDRFRGGRDDLWAHRAEDLTHLAPPMTPFDERL